MQKTTYPYFSYDPNSGFETHETAQEAIDEAEAAIQTYRDLAGDSGWSEDTHGVCWGVLAGMAGVSEMRTADELRAAGEEGLLGRLQTAGVDILVDYSLLPVYSTRPMTTTEAGYANPDLKAVAAVLRAAEGAALPFGGDIGIRGELRGGRPSHGLVFLADTPYFVGIEGTASLDDIETFVDEEEDGWLELNDGLSKLRGAMKHDLMSPARALGFVKLLCDADPAYRNHVHAVLHSEIVEPEPEDSTSGT